MKTRRVYIYVNGILTKPGETKNWTGRAVTWTHLATDYVAEKVEYWVGPVSRAFGRGQANRAEKLAKTLLYYARSGFEIIVVGHSNAGDVIGDAARTLDRHTLRAVKHVYLFAPACTDDMEEGGFNYLGAPVTIHIGGKDAALRIASKWGGILGYGSLGKDGPTNAIVPVEVVRQDEFHHSTWFEEEHFDDTMKAIFGLT